MLAYWGAHEAGGKHKDKLNIDLNNEFLCADSALRSRAHLITKILSKEPITVLLIELAPDDASSIVLFDGRKIQDWISDIDISDGESGQHLNKLRRQQSLQDERLVASAQYNENGKVAPLILWDGLHRAGAWYSRCEIGIRENIQCYLVLTKY